MKLEKSSKKSGLPVQKIPIKGQALVGTFFWMKLRCKQIIARNGTSKKPAVVSLCCNMACIIGFCVKTVYKIEIVAIGNFAPNWVLGTFMCAKIDLIPSHLGHFEAAAIGLRLAGQIKLDHLARDEAKPWHIALIAVVQQHLHANANTKQRLFGCRI